MIEFPPYRLDVLAGRLWRGDHLVPLRPKIWTLLRYLLERRGALVTKDDLHRAVWGDTVVSDATLTQTLAELREALGDDARAPRFIETVHGRGLRFVASPEAAPDGDQGRVARGASSHTRDPASLAYALVGRDAELAALDALFHQASAGQRQIVVIQGEPGIGKTALVEAFLNGLRASPDGAAIAYTQCVEPSGQREPYKPVLEAMERLSQGPDGERLRPLLGTIAPAWLSHMPSLEPISGPARPGRTDMTPDRMLSEFMAFVEAVSLERPLVLVIEDLHWSDRSTVDLVSMLAQRPEPARAMVVVTYRPAEAAALNHPFAQVLMTLRARHRCTDIRLEYLSRNDVRAHLQRRFEGSPVANDVARAVHARTDGNPLFMVTLVNLLLARGWLAEDGGVWQLTVAPATIEQEIPDDLRQLIEGQLRFLSPAERALLDVASVIGLVFDTPVVGAALDFAPDEVEALCTHLCGSHAWLRRATSVGRPDGSLSGRYAFMHALYRSTIYDRLPADRRAALHQRIGEWLEAAHAGRTAEVSRELATHFERGGDRRRAVSYLGQVARRGHERSAYRDVVPCIETALDLLGRLAETTDRHREELALRQLCSVALSQTVGYSAESLRENLTRARDLCERLADGAALFDVLHGLAFFHANRGDCAEAERIGTLLTEMSEGLGAFAMLQACYVRGAAALWTGNLGGAVPLLGRVLSSPAAPDEAERPYVMNPIVGARSFEGLRRWLVGDPDGAHAVQGEGLALAERLGRPFTLAQAMTFRTFPLLLDERWGEALRLSTRAVDLSEEYGFPRWLGTAHVCRGRALVEEGHGDRGLAEMGEGLRLLRGAGMSLGDSLHFSFLVGACLRLHRVDEALAAAEAGLAHCRDTTERVFEAELWRLKGECMLRQAAGETPARPIVIQEAETCLARARAVARAQGALMLERRASRWEAGVLAFQRPSG